jgi:YVTN family beta-propeller protein
LGIGGRPAAAAPFAYVANFTFGTVSVIATAANKVVATVTGLSSLESIAITPDGKHVYVTNSGNDTVSVIATVSNTVVATIELPAGAAPDGVAITRMGATPMLRTSASARSR